MKISDFIQQLFTWTDPICEHYTSTCDTLKAGNPDAELGSRIAVAMFATPDVIRAASAWGAKLLIVHEPTFYDHWDSMETFREQTGLKREILEKKLQLINDSGLTIYRYHDHPHYRIPDMISQGECKYFGLKGTWHRGATFGINCFTLDTPMNVKEIAAALEKNLNINQVQVAGCADDDFMVKNIALCFGTPGHLEDALTDCELALTGEICEWAQGEFIRDCNQFGLKKAVIVMGHCCSERDGMRLLAELIPQQENWKNLEVKYFESGDIYTALK